MSDNAFKVADDMGLVEDAAMSEFIKALPFDLGRSGFSTADIMLGRMFVGGPRFASSCPDCRSANIETGYKNGTEWLRCNACRTEYGGAAARA